MKKLIVILSFAALGLTSSASELYWMVDSSSASSAYAYANLFAISAVGADLKTATQLGSLAKADWSLGGFADITDYSGYSFFVELSNSQSGINYTGRADGSSVVSSLASSTSAGFSDAIYEGGISLPTSAYSFSNFGPAPAPEPTSGVLMLLGLAAFGLKRKRGNA